MPAYHQFTPQVDQKSGRGVFALIKGVTGFYPTQMGWQGFESVINALCGVVTVSQTDAIFFPILPSTLSLPTLCSLVKLHFLPDVLNVSCSLNLALNPKDCFTT